VTPPNSKAPTPADASQDREPLVDILAVWRPIRKHWLTALSTAALVTVGVGFWTMRQTKIYQAVSTVQFDPNPPRPLGGKVENVVEIGTGAMWDTREYYETQYQIIQSRRVSLAVVRALNLNSDWAFIMNLPKGAPVPDREPIPEEDAADMLRSRISVEPVKQSRLATVKFQDANPERAAELLKQIVRTYRDQNVDLALESMDEAARFLRTEHDKLKKELESRELDLHHYKKENNILSVEFEDKSSLFREQIAQLSNTLTSVRTRREQVASRRAQLAKVSGEDPSILPASELLQSAFLQNLRGQYVAALQERDALVNSGMGKNHPDVLGATMRMETARQALLSEVRNIQGALDSELAAIQREEGGVSGLFEQAKKESFELNLLEIEYNRRKRSKENTEKLYGVLLERSTESALTSQMRMNNVSIVDEPMVPGGPIRPNIPLNLTGGAALGLVVGAGAAMARSMLDRTMKSPEDVETVLNATFLGLLPEFDPGSVSAGKRRRRSALRHPELVVHEEPMSGVAEASRSIRTSLMFMAPDRPMRTLLVTSAGPSEGKTTVACCIAIAMAQAGKSVVLVDCDLRRPRIHRIFRGRGVDVGAGLTSALLDEPLDDCVIRSDVPHLSVIAAGPIPPNPSELLQSERFKAVLDKLREKYDHVILDSPPVVAVTDAVILSTMVDSSVLVIRALKTTKELGKHATRMLRDVGANLAGVVLNAVNVNRDEYDYWYKYYRRDGVYSSHTAPTPAPNELRLDDDPPTRNDRSASPPS
jgi:polysaccharide biosynthesis transport protein